MKRIVLCFYVAYCITLTYININIHTVTRRLFTVYKPQHSAVYAEHTAHRPAALSIEHRRLVEQHRLPPEDIFGMKRSIAALSLKG